MLPEGNDERILIAASCVCNLWMWLIFLSLVTRKQVESKVAELGLDFDFDKVAIINPTESEHYEDYVNTYYELRKAKNVSLAMAKGFNGRCVLFWYDDGPTKDTLTEWFQERRIRQQHTILPALSLSKPKPNSSCGFFRVLYVFRR